MTEINQMVPLFCNNKSTIVLDYYIDNNTDDSIVSYILKNISLLSGLKSMMDKTFHIKYANKVGCDFI